MTARCRAVLFDVDGTLYYQAPLRVAMASELGVSPWLRQPPQHVTQLWRILRTFRHVREELRGHQSEGESLDIAQYRRTAERLGVSADLVRSAVDEWMYVRPLKYLRMVRRAGAVAALEDCRTRGLPIGVFSDYPTGAKLRALGLDRFVSVEVCATDEAVNRFKPHPRGFLHACGRLGVDPSDVVYVGDRPEVDAVGAAAAGLRTLIIGRAGRGSRDAMRSMSDLGRAIIRTFEEPRPLALAVREHS